MENKRSLLITLLTTTLLISFLIFPTHATYGGVSLNEMMSPQEQKLTGINNLNATQKKALESWLDTHFEPKEESPIHKQPLMLSLNINDGAKLELTDGSVYEIDPDDHIYSSLWLTPFKVALGESGNAEYPVRITNLQTGTSVNGRPVSKEEIEEPSEQPKPTPGRIQKKPQVNAK
jgi:hypothetical protein